MTRDRIRTAIFGAAGRMGKRLVAIGAADPEIEIVAALEKAGHPAIGSDAGTLAGIAPLGVAVSSELPSVCDVVIDFSVPEASMEIAERCAGRGLAIVVATTGFEHEQREKLLAYSHVCPLLMSPSMSLTVNLVMKLASIAGQSLKSHPAGVDVEILERHHRLKEDAPSGTALKFGQIVAEAMGQTQHTHGRSGRIGKRPMNEIGYHAIRTGDNPGEHTVIFGVPGETIELTVRASNRDCYANGAMAAAKFLYNKAPGLYGMSDVLGL
ncbi:MAG TPA: 4-hydroxy-tetrahydrodipicolinate reductase [Pirellulales bacterium]